jgi:hypothetical protein
MEEVTDAFNHLALTGWKGICGSFKGGRFELYATRPAAVFMNADFVKIPITEAPVLAG